MIYLYITLQSENQNVNLGGACEHLKNSTKMLNWWVGEGDFSIIDYFYGWIRYMGAHITSVETVSAYNLGGAGSSKEVNV